MSINFVDKRLYKSTGNVCCVIHFKVIPKLLRESACVVIYQALLPASLIPRFCSLVHVLEVEERSSASVYYTERKPKNETGEAWERG